MKRSGTSGAATGINDASSRIESMTDTGVTLAIYEYLGTSGFVNAASPQPGIAWTLYGTGNDPNTGDIYWGLDRFGRAYQRVTPINIKQSGELHRSAFSQRTDDVQSHGTDGGQDAAEKAHDEGE